MEKKRTNNLYHVQVVKCAWISVEADSPSEAMRIAEEYIDDCITDEDFDDSEIEVGGCESYSHGIDGDYSERIFCEDCVLDADKYAELVKEAGE